ncbi:MAG: GTPase HflX, partial [Elusimicrobium sp.]|nr:GTPase HflX [Elusimicrobium sp.]
RTREGELQVELAQLKFLLPRLGGKGTALMQQTGGARGGIGTRGPGERKLEYDKRRLRLRITKLEREIEQVRLERAVRRARRDSLPVPQIAIVGYTNAGKSTLLNTLAKTKDVYADDKLFATLDPVTRRARMPEGGSVLFTDTVGFIQKLPHNLVHAFRATLEETAEADVILHVKDASAKDLAAQDAAVRGVITEIGAQKIPMVEVFNKTDSVSRHVLQNLKNNYRGALFISALKNTGIKELLEEVERALDYKWPLRTIKIPPEKSAAISYVYSHALIKEKKTERGGAVTFKLRMTDGNYAALKKCLTSL